MAAAELEGLFPRLRDAGYRIASPIDVAYNCVAFAATDQTRWWDPNHPDGFWPEGVARDDTIDGFVALFKSMGFARCEDAAIEQGVEKIAIYGFPSGAFTHVARQLPSGDWTSKLGELEDIVHSTLDGLDSRNYGSAVILLKRQSRS